MFTSFNLFFLATYCHFQPCRRFYVISKARIWKFIFSPTTSFIGIGCQIHGLSPIWMCVKLRVLKKDLISSEEGFIRTICRRWERNKTMFENRQPFLWDLSAVRTPRWVSQAGGRETVVPKTSTKGLSQCAAGWRNPHGYIQGCVIRNEIDFLLYLDLQMFNATVSFLCSMEMFLCLILLCWNPSFLYLCGWVWICTRLF